MAYDGPVLDNHLHLDPLGQVEEAVKQFHRSGGTHFVLIHKPYRKADGTRLNRTLEDHRADLETTLALAERSRKAVPEVQVLVALGPHPAEFTKALDAGLSMEEADALYHDALELAADLVREGRAHALGEIGRPHWEGVPEGIWERANAQMHHAFRLARELGVPAVIHCETGTPEVYEDLARWCDRAGLPRERAIKHYSPPIVDEALNHGLFPSVLVGKDAAESALEQGTRFVMETDYMDDPKYPGAVLGPKTVPKRTLSLLESGVLTPEAAWTIHHDNPRQLYGDAFEA